MLKFFNKLDEKTAWFEKWGITITLAILVILVFVNVVLRACFHMSVGWADEAERFAQIFAVYFGMGVAFKHGTHISVDVVVKFLLPKKSRKFFDILAHMITILFIIFVVYSGLLMTVAQYHTGAVSAILGVPRWIIYGAVPFGLLLSLIHEINIVLKIIEKDYSTGVVMENGGEGQC